MTGRARNSRRVGPKDRERIVNLYIDGATQLEIAATTGFARQTIARTLHRAPELARPAAAYSAVPPPPSVLAAALTPDTQTLSEKTLDTIEIVRDFLVSTIHSQIALCSDIDRRLSETVQLERCGNEIKALELARSVAQDKICAARRDLKAIDLEKPNEIVFLPTPRSYKKPPRPM
jgi:hypothetical protein